MRRLRSSLPACLLALACGPLAMDGGPEGSASTGSDGGVAVADAGAQPQPDAGSATGGPQGGTGRVTAVRNVKADAVRATTIYAHSIKADSLRCGRVVAVAESDLPPAGNQDLHNDNVAADELHAHDIDADLVQAATCYATKVDAKH